MEAANEAIYRRFVDEVLNAGDPEAADRFFAPEFVDHSLPEGVPGTLAGFKQWFDAFRRAFPDARWEIDVILAGGDLVARQQTFRATHVGEYLGVPPTGREVRASEAGIVRFDGGRMVEFWGVFDESALLRQLGAPALV
jgi:predicted ester cyclase